MRHQDLSGLLFSTILNLPWILLALIAGVISAPEKMSWHKRPWALIIVVRSFWWLEHLPGHKGVRAATLGSIVLIGRRQLKGDIEHELVHVEQYARAPFIQPLLYAYESLRHGYRQNKYEAEAYKRAGNPYIMK